MLFRCSSKVIRHTKQGRNEVSDWPRSLNCRIENGLTLFLSLSFGTFGPMECSYVSS